MTTAVLPSDRPPDGAPDPATGPGAEAVRDDGADRGRLDISSRAVARIATAAAAEVEGVGAPERRVLGQTVRSADLDRAVRVTPVVAGEVVTLDVELSVAWPHPVAEVVAAVRDRLAERLRTTAGLRLAHADVVVTALPRPARPRRTLS